MLLLAVLVVLFALLMSERRDLLDTYHRRRVVARAPEAVIAEQRGGPARSQLFLRNAFGRGLRDAFGAGLSWAAGLGGLAVLFAALTPNMRQALLQQASGPILRELERAGAVTEKGILSLLISFLLPPLVAVFGLTLVASWAGDETNQRLELELSMPVARRKVFLERFAASITMQAIAIAVSAVAMIVTVELIGADVPIGAIGAGSWTLVVLAASVTAVAFGIASWRPGLVTAAGGAFVVVSYFAGLVIPLLGLPSWARYVSVFSLYGSPIGDGVTYWRVGVLLALALVFAGMGAVQFQRRDIVK
jgi:ABC-2 type transport system permease protein